MEEKLRLNKLKLLFNIGAGNAANLLSESINKKIILDIPHVKILKESNNDKLFGYDSFENDTYIISSVSFDGISDEKADLVFSINDMKTFAKFFNLKNVNDNSDYTLTSIDFDLIKETTNIILSSIIEEIFNLFNINLEYTLPDVNSFSNIKLSGENLIYSYINIFIENTKIDGRIIVALTNESMNEIITKIDEMKDEINE